MVLMTSEVEDVLSAAHRSVLNIGGLVVEDEWSFRDRFRAEAAKGKAAKPKLLSWRDEWCGDGSSQRGLRACRREWSKQGELALFGNTVVSPVLGQGVGDAGYVVWRLAHDWRAGLSFGMDARSCLSVPNLKRGVDADGLTLWCAVVPAEAVLAVLWHPKAVQAGACPLWRTTDVDGLGVVRVAVDDCAEVVVDVTRLVESDSVALGCVTAMHRF